MPTRRVCVTPLFCIPKIHGWPNFHTLGRYTEPEQILFSVMAMWSTGKRKNGSSLRKQLENVGTMIISPIRKPGERAPPPEINTVVQKENKQMERSYHDTNISKGQTCAGDNSRRVPVREQHARTSSRS